MILAALSPPAATDVLLFRMDQARNISDVFVANQTASAVNVRVWAVPFDTVKVDAHAWVYNIAIPANSSLGILEGNTYAFALGEEIWVRSDTANVSFSLIGF